MVTQEPLEPPELKEKQLTITEALATPEVPALQDYPEKMDHRAEQEILVLPEQKELMGLEPMEALVLQVLKETADSPDEMELME